MPGKHAPSSPKRKPLAAIVALVAVLAVAIGAGAWWYLDVHLPHEEAVATFESAANGLAQRNAALDEAIASLQDTMGSEVQPLDASLSETASAAIGQAQGARQEAPAMPENTDEINAAAQEIEAMGDYAFQLDALSSAQQALDQSIQQRAQVTNPSEQFVIERLTGLPNVTGIEAATEENDPNGNLHKDGGYTSAVFFSSDLVDSSQVYLDPSYTGIPSAGCDGGGCVEVYATEQDAVERDTYLAAFDGSILRPGSHTVLGTCVVRTSDLLTASQQEALEQSIAVSLTRLA